LSVSNVVVLAAGIVLAAMTALMVPLAAAPSERRSRDRRLRGLSFSRRQRRES